MIDILYNLRVYECAPDFSTFFSSSLFAAAAAVAVVCVAVASILAKFVGFCQAQWKDRYHCSAIQIHWIRCTKDSLIRCIHSIGKMRINLKTTLEQTVPIIERQCVSLETS